MASAPPTWVAFASSARRCCAFGRVRSTVVPSHSGRRLYSTWQAPSCDCYALLGISRSATDSEIKKAYLAKAKASHPDVGGGDSGKMAQLNVCYEALTQKRAEYDASKGVGGSGPRASAYSAGRDPWWKGKENPAEDFADFGGFEWDDLCYGRTRGFKQRQESSQQRPPHQHASSSAGQQPNWKEWAETWRTEHNASSEFRKRAQRRRGRRSSWHDDSESDSDDADDEPRDSRRAQRGAGARHWQDAEQDTDSRTWDGGSSSSTSKGRRPGGRSSQPWQQGATPPSELWIALPSGGRRGAAGGESWDRLAGQYSVLEEHVNGRAAYAKVGNRSLFLFWSKEFGDWKLAERLEDDGACLAFAEDLRGKRPPWMDFAPRWRLWDPAAKRFVLRRLSVVGCEEAEPNNAEEGARGKAEQADDDDGEIPWSRPPWDLWKTADLMKWCERRNIDLGDCFDRESVLEKVISAATQATSETGRRRKGRKPSGEDDASDDSSDDEDRFSQRRGGRGSRRDGGGDGGGRHSKAKASDAGRGWAPVRVASRVKTDGSYTRPPSLDKRVAHYGNRVERFHGEEAAVLPWLYDSGDKSRLYTVYFDGEVGYSLVWKKGKYWGRPSFRSPRREAYDW